MVNAALTARVGRAAIEVCRPLPYQIQERPKISVILRRALTSIFDKSPD
jgi:putative membrane protein